MNIEEAREYCLSLYNVTESFPFDDVNLVFKVENKMFALLSLDAEEIHLALKCDPAKAEELRERYHAVEPAWHFHKKYWNDVYLERDMKEDEIKKWIRHSYAQVIAKLPKKTRDLYKEVINESN
ncbi:MAG: MmcQ/YjbR family DNA-binding protein [Tannerellaceae bacterium]|nr:MmcQ/YjbR family DNA-binding protein [Tannerellaceae bacterium]